VGPNGSGKSNVIDAMMFVFGKRAKQVTLRTSQPVPLSLSTCMISTLHVELNLPLWCRSEQLRLNRVSELIHNSTKHQNLEMAKVTVVFHEIIDLVGAPLLLSSMFWY
jgi:structural maintenance of chromosome 4